jgi:hypothetical protein
MLGAPKYSAAKLTALKRAVLVVIIASLSGLPLLLHLGVDVGEAIKITLFAVVGIGPFAVLIAARLTHAKLVPSWIDRPLTWVATGLALELIFFLGVSREWRACIERDERLAALRGEREARVTEFSMNKGLMGQLEDATAPLEPEPRRVANIEDLRPGDECTIDFRPATAMEAEGSGRYRVSRCKASCRLTITCFGTPLVQLDERTCVVETETPHVRGRATKAEWVAFDTESGTFVVGAHPLAVKVAHPLMDEFAVTLRLLPSPLR